MQFVRSFEELRLADFGLVGGKNASLGDLTPDSIVPAMRRILEVEKARG